MVRRPTRSTLFPYTTLVRSTMLLDVAKTKKLFIQIGHIERFNPVVTAYIKNMNNNPEFMEIHRLTPFNERGNDIDVVLDLAAISNDPAGELNPEKTFEINHKGRARVAMLSKKNGVKRYILASSASIYGQQENIAD